MISTRVFYKNSSASLDCRNYAVQ